MQSVWSLLHPDPADTKLNIQNDQHLQEILQFAHEFAAGTRDLTPQHPPYESDHEIESEYDPNEYDEWDAQYEEEHTIYNPPPRFFY